MKVNDGTRKKREVKDSASLAFLFILIIPVQGITGTGTVSDTERGM